MANITHAQVMQMINNYYQEKGQERKEALRARDFRDGKQLTDSERRELRRKGIPDTVVDMIGPKIDHLQGIELGMEIGPECQPRTSDDVQGASVVRHCIEYILDTNRYKARRSTVFDGQCTEGYAGFYVYLKPTLDNTGFDVKFDNVRPRDFIYDPLSCEEFFEDAKFLGFRKFIDAEDLEGMFPGKKDVISSAVDNSFGDYMHEEWRTDDRNRLAVVFLNVKKKGVWYEMLLTAAGWLVKPQVSVLTDENSETLPSVIAASAYIDSDDDRYGPTRRMIDPQMIYNKAHQMSTHAIRAQQLKVREDIYKDKKRLATLRTEASRADGVLPFTQTPDEVMTMDNTAKIQGNLELAARAQQALDLYGANTSLTGDIEGEQSGVALNHRANQGTVELSRLYANHKELLVRLYQTVWYAARLYWPEGKEIRVSGVKKAPEFIKVNVPQPSFAELAVEKFGMVPQRVIDLGREEGVDITKPRMDNNLKDINIDVVITETENHANMIATQFEALREMALQYPDVISPIDVVKASNISIKDEIIERNEKQQAAQAESAQAAQQQQEALNSAQIQSMTNALNAQAESDLLDNQQKQQEIMIEASEAQVKNEKTVAETTKIYHDINQPQIEKPRQRVRAGF